MVIIDASIVIKWFREEEDSDRALRLVHEEELAAPDLLLYEVCNVLSAVLRLPIREVHEALDKLYRLPIQFFVLPSHGFRRTADLACRFQISAYDASYIALAESLHASLVTADKKLIRRTSSLSFVRDLNCRQESPD